MSDQIEAGDGFSAVEKSSGGYGITGRYPFYGEVKSEDDSFEVILQNSSAPTCEDINIYLKVTDSVSSILNFTFGPENSGVQTLELVNNLDGLLVLDASGDPEHPESRLNLLSGSSGVTVLVTDGDGTLHFLAAPDGKHVFGVSKYEYETGKFKPLWCWYGITTCEDACAETEES